MSHKEIRAGIDEAGLGPILGPLAVAGVAFQLEPGSNDLYENLREILTRHASSRQDTRLVVDDSKRVFSGPRGLSRLEKTALSFLALPTGSPLGSAEALCRLLAKGGNQGDRRGCPWLENIDLELPLATTKESIEISAWRLQKEMDSHGIRVAEITLTALHAGPFNRDIDLTNNKSATHYKSIMDVAGSFFHLAPLKLEIDRTGGRIKHSLALAKAFPGVGVTKLEEAKERQGYRLRVDGNRNIETWFIEKGEDFSFFIALASCLAKYVREVFIEAMNRWFISRLPGLKPTKGYYVDGKRFLNDVAHVIQKEGIDPKFLIRNR